MSKIKVRIAIDSLELGSSNMIYRKTLPLRRYTIFDSLGLANNSTSYSVNRTVGYGDSSKWVEYMWVRGYGEGYGRIFR